MKIAYLITAYKDEKQLAKLIDALTCEEAHFYIHIDKKVSDVPFKEEVKQLVAAKENRVFWVEASERVKVNWGGYSQIKAQMSLIREMLGEAKVYDWCINLTGTDYPIVSNEEIQEFLKQQDGRPVIKGYQLDCIYGTEREEMVKDRIRKYWFYDIEPVFLRKVISKIVLMMQNLFKIRRRPRLEAMPWKFCYGSEYWALPFTVLQKVYQEYLQDTALQKVLKTAFVPSEFWVQTVLMSTDILSDEQKEMVRFPGDRYDGLGSVALLHYFVYCGYIKVLGMEDYESIISSGKLFMRKAQTGVSDELINRINKSREIE